MKTLAFLLIVTAVPALAQESPADGTIFDALKVGDWVSYRASTTGDLLDITIVDKAAGTTIKAYRDKLTKERTDVNAQRSRLNEAMQELQSADIPFEERNKRMAELRQQRDELTPFRSPSRGSTAAPYEVTALRKEYLVLNNGAQERFIAKSAVRMIIRNLPAGAAEAEK
jgi:hypothetical protein